MANHCNQPHFVTTDIEHMQRAHFVHRRTKGAQGGESTGLLPLSNRYHVSRALADYGQRALASQIRLTVMIRMQCPYRIVLWRLDASIGYLKMLYPPSDQRRSCTAKPRQPRRLPAAQCVSDCNKLQGTLVSGKVRNTFTEHA